MAAPLAKTRTDLIFKDDPDDPGRVFVKDPLRHKYFHFNELQVAMMRALDGRRSTDELIELLGIEFGDEISADKIDRFIERLRGSLLLDVSSYQVDNEKTRRLVAKRLRKMGLEEQSRLRGGSDHEAWLFSAALKQAHSGDPCKAASYFEALLEVAPEDSPTAETARKALTCVHESFFKTAQSRMHHPMIHLWNPDSFLGRIDRRIGRYVYSPLGFGLIVLFIISSIVPIIEIFSQPDVMSGLGALDILSFEITVLAAIFVHELGHGLSVKHYGGRVTDIGVMLFFGVLPAAYCDTSDTYLFRKKRHKIVVYFSGVIPQMVLQAGLWYLLAFTNSSLPGYQGILLALIVNFWWNFLNLNPLIPLDAYFALADYLGIKNLRPRAFSYVRAMLYRKVFGIKFILGAMTDRERRIFLIYGTVAMVYTIAYIYFLWLSILLPLAVEHLGAWGLLLAGFYFANLFGRIMFVRFCRMLRLVFRMRRQVFTRRRSLVFAAVLGGLAWLLSTPVPHYVDGSMEVEPRARGVVRAGTAGVIAEVHVEEGQWVKQGDVIAVQRSTSLERARAVAALELLSAQSRLAILERGARDVELAEASAHRRMQRVLSETRREQLDETAHLHQLGLASSGRLSRQLAAVSSAESAQHLSEIDLGLLRAGTRSEELAVAAAEVREKQEQLNALDAEIAQLLIRAPLDGLVVGRVGQKKGAYLAAGQALVEVHDLTGVRARISTRRGYDGISPGQHVSLVASGAPNTVVQARVDDVLTPDSEHLVLTSSEVPNEVWRSGMSGRARIYGPDRSVAYQLFAEPMMEIVNFNLWRLVWG